MMTQILIFVSISAPTFLVMAFFDPYRARMRDRVNNLGGNDDDPLGSSSERTENATHSWHLKLQSLIPYSEKRRARIQQQFGESGNYSNDAASYFLVKKLLCIAILGSLGLLLSSMSWVRMEFKLLLVIGMFTAGVILPNYWLERAIAQRRTQLQKSLPDFLDLMIVCLGGGMSLQDTIRRTAEELQIAHPILAGELTIVRRDVELGATVDQALKRFAVRSNYDGIRSLSTFIRESQRFGTRIEEALRSHADMLRSRREQEAEEKVRKRR